MEKFINLLRNNVRYYTYTLVIAVICLILSVLVMALSSTISLYLVCFFFILNVYLYYFIGVNPYYKGIIYSILPVILSIVILKFLTYLPIPNKWEWLLEGNSRGRGGATEAIFTLILYLIIKITGVKPFRNNFDE
jgi:hypothetical protein